MTTVLDALAVACTVGGLLVGLLVLVRLRDLRLAVGTALELWLAAGLIRLSDPDASWTALATAAAIVATRRLVGGALRRSRVSVFRRPRVLRRSRPLRRPRRATGAPG